jgi:hypothetical protein
VVEQLSDIFNALGSIPALKKKAHENTVLKLRILSSVSAFHLGYSCFVAICPNQKIFCAISVNGSQNYLYISPL